MPAASNMRSMRSISCTWYCIVSRSSKYNVAFVPSGSRRSRLCAITSARKSFRTSAYFSRLKSVSRVSFSIPVPPFDPSYAVGAAQERHRMLRPELVETLADLFRGHGAIAHEMLRVSLVDLVHHGPCNLFRDLVEFLLDGVGTV